MPTSSEKSILCSPLVLLRPSTMEERGVFSGQQGWFYTFGLKSGQSFVACFSQDKEIYTFRPLRNLLPDLIQIEWIKSTNVECMGYDTICSVKDNVSDKKALYEEILKPHPDDDDRTKVAFRRYRYSPLLEHAVCLRNQLQSHEMIKRALADSEQQLQNLMIPNVEISKLIQKNKERRQ